MPSQSVGVHHQLEGSCESVEVHHSKSTCHGKAWESITLT